MAKTVGRLDTWASMSVKCFPPRRQKRRENVTEMGKPARRMVVRAYVLEAGERICARIQSDSLLHS